MLGYDPNDEDAVKIPDDFPKISFVSSMSLLGPPPKQEDWEEPKRPPSPPPPPDSMPPVNKLPRSQRQSYLRSASRRKAVDHNVFALGISAGGGVTSDRRYSSEGSGGTGGSSENVPGSSSGLVRAGRFEQAVALPAPTMDERESIVRRALKFTFGLALRMPGDPPHPAELEAGSNSEGGKS